MGVGALKLISVFLLAARGGKKNKKHVHTNKQKEGGNTEPQKKKGATPSKQGGEGVEGR